MVRGKGGSMDRSLTHGEIQDITMQKQEAEATLKHLAANPGTARQDTIDKTRLQKEAKYLDRVLQENSPKVPRGTNRDSMVKEAGEIAQRIKINLPTRAEMDSPAKHPGAVHKHLKWLKNNETDVRRYKEIMRRVEPNDPTATDIEKMRKEK